jgi:hypothetical protein
VCQVIIYALFRIRHGCCAEFSKKVQNIPKKGLSNADPDLLPAEEYSADGVHWLPIPKGITVVGSRYAMILGEIKPGELIINPADYEVVIGKSRG